MRFPTSLPLCGNILVVYELQPCLLLLDLQLYLATLYHWRIEATVVPHGEVITNRNVVVLQVFVEHVVHVCKTIFRTLVFGEMPHDDAFQLRQNATNLQLMKHAINF